MLNLLRNKFQMHLFAPEPLSVTVLSRQEAEAQAPTFGSNDFVVSIGNPEQAELHFPCPALHLHFFDKEDDRCITEEQAEVLAAFVRKEIGLGRHHLIDNFIGISKAVELLNTDASHALELCAGKNLM